MYQDVKHETHCAGMRLQSPQMRDCTCGVIIDSLLAERRSLQESLDKAGCPHCSPAKLYEILGDPAFGVSLFPPKCEPYLPSSSVYEHLTQTRSEI